jgi:hypothetical protein
VIEPVDQIAECARAVAGHAPHSMMRVVAAGVSRYREINCLRAADGFRHHGSGGVRGRRNLLEDGRQGDAEGAAYGINGRAGSGSQQGAAAVEPLARRVGDPRMGEDLGELGMRIEPPRCLDDAAGLKVER